MQRRKRPRCELERGGGLETVERKLAFAAKGVSKHQLQRIATAAGVQSSMYRLYDSVQREATPLLYQETLKTVDGDPKTWDLYDPTRLVQHVLNTCTDLAEIYRSKLTEVPAPWPVAHRHRVRRARSRGQTQDSQLEEVYGPGVQFLRAGRRYPAE